MSEASQRPWGFYAYLGINNDTLWSIIEDDIPTLLLQLRILRDNLTPDL